MHKLVKKLVPETLCSIITDTTDIGTYLTRQKFDLLHFKAQTKLFATPSFRSNIQLWNQLAVEIRNSESIQIF